MFEQFFKDIGDVLQKEAGYKAVTGLSLAYRRESLPNCVCGSLGQEYRRRIADLVEEINGHPALRRQIRDHPR